jgi:hypothetical protein
MESITNTPILQNYLDHILPALITMDRMTHCYV